MQEARWWKWTDFAVFLFPASDKTIPRPPYSSHSPHIQLSSDSMTPWDHISFWHFVKHIARILQTLAFNIHVNKRSPYEDIILECVALNYFSMNLSTTFKVFHEPACSENAGNHKLIWLDASLFHLVKQYPGLLAMAFPSISCDHDREWNSIGFRNFIKDCARMKETPTLEFWNGEWI